MTPATTLSKRARFAIFLALPALLNACAKEEKGAAALSDVSHPVLTGSLEENVQAILKDDWREACDEKSGPRMLEIAAALDSRSAAINAFAMGRPAQANANWKTARVGPTTVQERVKPLATEKGWKITDQSSWDDIAADYEKAKQLPVGKEWYYLNNYARGVLIDDVNRVVNGQNFALYHNMGSILELMRSSVSACYKDEACVKIPFGTNERAFIEGQPKYRRYLKAMNDASGRETKRKWIANFALTLKNDLRKFTFRVNENVRQVEPGVFEVPMDAGPFAEVSDQLKSYVESIWSGGGKQVRVLWKDRASNPDIYRILLGESVGERAYVNHVDREMMLFPNVRSRSIAHETGHVLGFPDVYYTIWDPAKCSYKTIAHVESLMGDSADGVVLPEHWAQLEKSYPIQGSGKGQASRSGFTAPLD